jgi:hypothetical protein
LNSELIVRLLMQCLTRGHLTVKLTKQTINSRLLQLNAPSFPTGDGSNITGVIWLEV